MYAAEICIDLDVKVRDVKCVEEPTEEYTISSPPGCLSGEFDLHEARYSRQNIPRIPEPLEVNGRPP